MNLPGEHHTPQSRPSIRATLAVVVLLLVTLGAACGGGDKSTPVLVTPRAAPTFTPRPEVPSMTIDTTKTYIATLKTEVGDIVIELTAKETPITVNNFVELARKGYYNGTTFHRVLADFMAQGGDPTGTGAGGPGYSIQDEFTDLTHERGVISMANAGPNTGGSQFFITLVPTPHLDGRHTVFGKVIEGMEVVEALKLRDPGQSPPPDFPGTTLNEVLIEER